MSAVANGGWLMKPYLVAEIRDEAGRPVARTTPVVRRRPIAPDTVHALTTILEGVVTNGTGTKASVPGYRVAGKTGTAQKIDPMTGGYSATSFVGSFLGYAPVGDPRITVLVIIDEPQTEAWGGVVAAPVFRRVVEQVLPYLGIFSTDVSRLALAGSPGKVTLAAATGSSRQLAGTGP
jgi:cell division protein FtsI (penicillin-binding protein 3)